jgi:hypothetical protein
MTGAHHKQISYPAHIPVQAAIEGSRMYSRGKYPLIAVSLSECVREKNISLQIEYLL